jgi:hypothetical protein
LRVTPSATSPAAMGKRANVNVAEAEPAAGTRRRMTEISNATSAVLAAQACSADVQTSGTNAKVHTEIQECIGRIAAHPIMADLERAMPLTVGQGATIAPLEAKDFACALRKAAHSHDVFYTAGGAAIGQSFTSLRLNSCMHRQPQAEPKRRHTVRQTDRQTDKQT